MARKRAGTFLRNIAEAALQDAEDKIKQEAESLLGKRTARVIENIFPESSARGAARPRPAGVLAMMAAEPGMMLDAALDPQERQSAIAGHGMQHYQETFDEREMDTNLATGVWVQLNLAKHQALLVQRIRISNRATLASNTLIGLRWGRPAGAIGTGAPGHESPGQKITWPRVGNFNALNDNSSLQAQSISDISFVWNTVVGATGGYANPATQELDLRPNYVLIRSYCLVMGGTAGVPNDPYINLFGKIVNLDFSNILTVRH